MVTIKADLPSAFDRIEIHLFADEHIGDQHSDLKRVRDRIEYVRTHDNAYCILDGDIMDTATRSSIGDIETRQYNVMEQLELSVELFEPIKNKILAITNGNHENRIYRKEGFDTSKAMAMQLGIADRYSPTSALLFIRFGEYKMSGRGKKDPVLFTAYISHGFGGGRKEGSKILRLADMASIIDTDIYIMAHQHLPMTFKESFYRIDRISSTAKPVRKMFVNTAANLDYGGYGEAALFKPSCTDMPVIHLGYCGKNKIMETTV